MGNGILIVTQNGISSDSRVLRELRSLEKLEKPLFLLCLDSLERRAMESKSSGVRVVNISSPIFNFNVVFVAGQVFFVSLTLLVVTSFFVSPVASSFLHGVLLFSALVGALLNSWIMSQHGRAAHIRGRLEKFGTKIWDLLFGYRVLEQAIRQTEPGAIHLHDLAPLVALRRGALPRGREIPVIWDAHELYHEQQGNNFLTSMAKKALIRSRLSQVRHVVTVSEGVARAYERAFVGFPPWTIVANASSAAPVLTRSDILQTRLGLPPGSEILLFQGGLVPGRGIPFLLELIRFLPEAWKLVFMGSGSLETLVRRAADGEGKRVFFHPAVSPLELSEFTSSATLGAIPYERGCLNHEYALPNKLWEYSVAGVPILARDLNDLSQVIEDQGIGFVFGDRDDAKSVADRIAATSQTEWSALSRGALAFASADNWEKYENRLLALYDTLR